MHDSFGDFTEYYLDGTINYGGATRSISTEYKFWFRFFDLCRDAGTTIIDQAISDFDINWEDSGTSVTVTVNRFADSVDNSNIINEG